MMHKNSMNTRQNETFLIIGLINTFHFIFIIMSARIYKGEKHTFKTNIYNTAVKQANLAVHFHHISPELVAGLLALPKTKYKNSKTFLLIEAEIQNFRCKT